MMHHPLVSNSMDINETMQGENRSARTKVTTQAVAIKTKSVTNLRNTAASFSRDRAT